MNWLLVIKNFLGRFWGDFFHDGDFLPGVEFLVSLYSRVAEYRLLNWRNGMIAADTSSMPSDLPYPVLIDQAKVNREWYSWDALWGEDPATSDDMPGSMLIDGTYYNDDEDKMGWVAPAEEAIKEPYMLKTHLYGNTLTLVEGVDYDYSNGVFLFYVDLSELNIPTVMVTDKEGYPHKLYRLFGVPVKETKVCDPVTGFESNWLNGCCDIAWDIHQNGATFFNTKKLLGKASHSVICEEDGTVMLIWEEQGYSCMRVGDRVYHSKEAANYAVGASVKQGDVLFGTLKMFKGAEVPSADEIPGLKVMTDVGELTAMNELRDIVTDEDSGVEILPLTGNEATIEAYNALCVEHAANKNCPVIDIPITFTTISEAGVDVVHEQVNPYTFISNTLRRGRSVVARMQADDVELAHAALDCVRKSCCASGMMNVYLETSNDYKESDQVAILNTASFMATAGMLAVAEVGTIGIKEAYAEAKLI